MKDMEIRKVTVHLPAELLEGAMQMSGVGVTETIRLGLKKLTHAKACEELGKLRGKVKLDIDLQELREDRDLSRFYKRSE